MGFLSLMYPWGVLLQALAIVHFLRRRPRDGRADVRHPHSSGPPGALIYILIEVVPDLGLLRHAVQAFGRRKRISHTRGVVLENPSAGNYEELGDLYLEEEKFARARECYDKSRSRRCTIQPDQRIPISDGKWLVRTDDLKRCRRLRSRLALAAIRLKSIAAAITDVSNSFTLTRIAPQAIAVADHAAGVAHGGRPGEVNGVAY